MKTVGQMTEKEFDRYMKRNDLTGLAAVRVLAKRREQLAEIEHSKKEGAKAVRCGPADVMEGAK